MNVFETSLGHRFIESVIAYLNKEKRIDWEQRRYEIARDLFTATNFGTDKPLCSLVKENSPEEQYMVQRAVRMADKLIEELKKK